MTSDKQKFTSLKSKIEGYETFEDNTKCNTFGIGIIGTHPYIGIERLIYQLNMSNFCVKAHDVWIYL